jgi:hypothetical protein
MSAINNVSTANGYTPAATLNCPPSDSLTVQVGGAGVFYQLLLTPISNEREGPSAAYYNRPGDSLTGSGTGIATEERTLLPGYWLFDTTDFRGEKCVGVQFRSMASGSPAIVSASN